MIEWLHEPTNVYAMAFGIFWLLMFLFVRKPAFLWLDGEIAKISAELKTAHQLRTEAQNALAEVQIKQMEAEAEAKKIVQMAKDEAAAMRKQADAELAATLARQQQLAKDRIHMAQEKAVSAVRAEAIRLGMELARKTLTEDLAEADASKLLERAIVDIPSLKPRSKKNQEELL